MAEGTSIVVVETDGVVLNRVLQALRGRDCQTACVETGAEALDAIRVMHAEACWIGSLRPGGPFADPTDLSRELRKHFPDLAILTTGTASADLDAASACIAAGADACYPPDAQISTIWFGTAALVANRRARRTVCDLGAVRIFLLEAVLEIDGQRVELTPKEHGILSALAKAHPHALPTAELHRDSLGYLSEPSLDSNPVAQLVRRLRKKLGRYACCLVSSRAGYGLERTDFFPVPTSGMYPVLRQGTAGRVGEPTGTE